MTQQHGWTQAVDIPKFTFGRIADRMLAIVSAVAMVFVFIMRNDPTPLLAFVLIAFVVAFFSRQHRTTIERPDISQADLEAAADTSKLVLDVPENGPITIKPRWFQPILHEHLTTYVTRSDNSLSLAGPRQTVRKLATLFSNQDADDDPPIG